MSQPESKLSRQIMNALRARGAFVFKVHGGPTMMSGLPDIVGVYRGHGIGVETKMPGNRPTPIQLRVHDQMREAGAFVVIAHNIPEAVAVLDAVDARIPTR